MGNSASRYASHVSKKVTPQSEQADKRQAKNNAGGFSFVIDDWARLDRFLILGADSGTYYVQERQITKDNAACVERCLDADGARTVARIVEVSEAGSAPKNDAAIFALALAASHKDAEVRKAALAALPRVCRIGTHIFSFAAAVDQFRGWGGGLRRAVASWYNDKGADKLAYQVLKYQQRNGWSHRDMLRLAHAAPPGEEHAAIYRWIAAQGNLEAMGERTVLRKGAKGDTTKAYAAVDANKLPAMLALYEGLKKADDEKTVIKLVTEHGFTHEMIPTQFKNSAAVWEALLQKMPMTAMIRNLGKMTEVGLIKPLSEAARLVETRLGDGAVLKKARVHPLTVLMAAAVYAQGHGIKGKLSWSPVPTVTDALNEAFYLAFDAVEPTNKRILVALDVSGSMGAPVAGSALSCAQASGALALVIARTELRWHIMGFAAADGDTVNYWNRSQNAEDVGGIRDLGISSRMRLGGVMQKIQGLNFGGTDCSLPMRWALKNEVEADAFVVLTDNETWAGPVHPHQALDRYRKEMGIAAKLIVMSMTATEFSIADPSDGGMLDVVGLDGGALKVIADFIRDKDSKAEPADAGQEEEAAD